MRCVRLSYCAELYLLHHRGVLLRDGAVNRRTIEHAVYVESQAAAEWVAKRWLVKYPQRGRVVISTRWGRKPPVAYAALGTYYDVGNVAYKCWFDSVQIARAVGFLWQYESERHSFKVVKGRLVRV